MKFNVRCCCTPTKIFGTLELPIGDVRVGGQYPHRTHCPVTLRTSDGSILTENIELRRFRRGFGEPDELAVYSDDRPIEFWRQMRTFKEGDSV